MGARAFEVVPFEPSRRGEVLDLLTLLWTSSRRRNEQVFAWKYEHNPYRRTPALFLGMVGDRVVGTRGFQAGLWQLGTPTRTELLAHAGDSVIAPAHRRSGLLRALDDGGLTHLREAGFRAAVSLSAGAVVRTALAFYGWRARALELATWRSSASDVRDWFHRRVRRLALGARRSSSLAAAALLLRALLPAPFPPSRAPLATGVAASSEPPVEAMARLVEDLGHDGRARHLRDRQYLAWRYRNPLSTYRFLLLQSGCEPEGYLVLQAARSRLQHHVHVVDWEARDERVAGELLGAAKTLARQPLVVWSSGLSEARRTVLASGGFRVTPRGRTRDYRPTLLVRELRDGSAGASAPDLGDLGSWDLRAVFGDGV